MIAIPGGASGLEYTAPALEKESNKQVWEVLEYHGKTEYDIIETGSLGADT